MKNFILFVALIIQLEAFSQTQDSAFGNSGLVNVKNIIGAGFQGVRDFALQQDEKIVILSRYVQDGNNNGYALCRLLKNGSLDRSFGTDGVIKKMIRYTSSFVERYDFNRLVVQPDNRIIVSASFYTQSTWSAFVYAYYTYFERLIENGTPDSSFDRDGNTLANGNGTYNILLQPNNFLLVDYSGYCDYDYFNDRFCETGGTFRLESDGKIDDGFNAAGGPYACFSDVNNNFVYDYHSSVLQPVFDTKQTFKIVQVNCVGIERLNRDGSYDLSFSGGDGIFPAQTFKGYQDLFRFAAIQRDGKILAMGMPLKKLNDNNYDTKFTLLRLKDAGTLDNSFGNNGRVLSDLFHPINMTYANAALLSMRNGKFITAAYGTTKNGKNASVLTRFLSNGLPDKTFGKNGAIELPGEGGVSKLQCNEKILHAPQEGNSIYRYLNNGADACPSQISNNIQSAESFEISANSLTISPNPSQGIVTATYQSNFSGSIQLNVFDKTGKLMFTKTENAIKGNNTYQLNLSHLINGMYNLQLNNGSELNQSRFIIEK